LDFWISGRKKDLKGLSVSLPGAFGSWGLLAAVGTFSCGFLCLEWYRNLEKVEKARRGVWCVFTKTVQPWILSLSLFFAFEVLKKFSLFCQFFFFVFCFYYRILAFPVVFTSCYLVVWWRFGFTRAGILQGKKGRVGHVKKGNWKTKRRIRESGGGGTSREEV
jgi:hypothetical protein